MKIATKNYDLIERIWNSLTLAEQAENTIMVSDRKNIFSEINENITFQISPPNNPSSGKHFFIYDSFQLILVKRKAHEYQVNPLLIKYFLKMFKR